MILISELIWLTMYVIVLILSIYINDIFIMSVSFIILGLSGIELSIGIIISILYKNSNESLNLEFNNKKNNQLDYLKKFKNVKNNI